MASFKRSIKKGIISLIPNSIIKFIQKEYLNEHKYYSYQNLSFAQEGEDMILSRLFEDVKNGYYIDVGAHHPIRFSNTYKFYLKGWCGINIDAMPNSMREFQKIRPRDLNLEIPVSDNEEILEFYIFNEKTLNTFSKDQVEISKTYGNYDVTEIVELKPVTLGTILSKYLPESTIIDFMSVDVEGYDLNVLKSNDWALYRPKVVLVEILRSSFSNLSENLVYQFLQMQGYEMIAKSFNTIFFRDIIENE
ncbi:MAG: hypothetical protein ACI83B_002932 [Sediminicola sp.]|jgi:hypothetical protein